jgi:hypothetical protein
VKGSSICGKLKITFFIHCTAQPSQSFAQQPSELHKVLNFKLDYRTVAKVEQGTYAIFDGPDEPWNYFLTVPFHGVHEVRTTVRSPITSTVAQDASS